MRLVIQRVKHASVTVGDNVTGAIGQGLLILIGIEDADTAEDISWLAAKTVNMRIFDDDNGVMNRSVMDVGGDVLVVSQFTLMASTRKGNRPSYIRASGHAVAIPAYESFCAEVSRLSGRQVATGVFGADMKVELLNDGPVTIFIDSKLRE
jgi:D-tyrosyl-tRNA(Tyr) deacylase